MIFDYVKIILISLALSNLGVTPGLARLLADGTLSSAATKVKVKNGKGLVEALRNLQRGESGSVVLEVVSLQGGAPGVVQVVGSDLVDGPVSLGPETTVVITSEDTAVIDFGRTTSAIVLGPNATLEFQNMVVGGLASSHQLGPNYPYFASPVLLAWPSIAGSPNSTVKWSNTTIKGLYDSCRSFNSPETLVQLRQLYGDDNVLLNGLSLTLKGTHTETVPLYDYQTKKRVGSLRLVIENSTVVCTEDPLALAPAPAGSELGQDIIGHNATSWTSFRLTGGAVRAVSVSNSSAFASAMQDGGVDSILITNMFNTTEAGRIVLNPKDWGNGGRPVTIQPDRHVTITSAAVEPAQLDFNHLVAAISISQNATLVLNNLEIVNLSSHHAADGPSFPFTKARELQIWPSFILEGGSQVIAANLTLSAAEDNCTNRLPLMTRQAQMLFGEDRVQPVGNGTGAQYKGLFYSNVTLLDSSSGAYAGQVDVYFTNFTRYCVDDTWPDNAMVKAPSGPEQWQQSEVDTTPSTGLGARERLATSSAEVAALLRDPTISGVRLVSNVKGVPPAIKLNPSDFMGVVGPVTIQGGRTVRVFAGKSRGRLDLNGFAPAIIVSPGATLVFQDVDLQGLASPKSYNYSYYPYLLGMWPTISAQANSTVHLINTRSFVPGRTCYMVKNITYPFSKELYGSSNVVQPNLQTVGVLDNHSVLLPTNDYIISSDKVPKFRLLFDNTSGTCIPHMIPPYPPPPVALSAAAMPESAEPSSSNKALLGGLIGSILGAVFLVVAFVAFGFWRRRRRGDVGKDTLEHAEKHGVLSTPPGSNDGAAIGSGRMSDRGSADYYPVLGDPVLRMKTGLLEKESVEWGPAIGKGAFGKVYKGRWQGALVAIKVVEHDTHLDESPAAVARRIERETLCSTSLAHPNIVSTYKITTVCKGLTGPGPGPQPASDSVSSILSGNQKLDFESVPDTDAGEEPSQLETWLLMEYCDKGNLGDAVKRQKLVRRDNGQPDMPLIVLCLLDIASGMEYLHSHDILHSDLKPENVVLKSTTNDPRCYCCKLTDFGLSRWLDPSVRSHVSTQTFGTIPYMPAEFLITGRLTKAVDVYSFGMIMSELYTMKTPFEGYKLGQITACIVNNRERPEVPEHCPDDYRSLLEACWADDASLRPTFAEIRSKLQQLGKLYKFQRGLPEKSSTSSAT